jgi:MFS family permease
MTVERGALIRFMTLYAALFSAFGFVSPFLPAFLAGRGLGPEELGFVLGAATALRLVCGPIAGRLADRLQAFRGEREAPVKGRDYLAFRDIEDNGRAVRSVGHLRASLGGPTNDRRKGLAASRPNNGSRFWNFVSSADAPQSAILIICWPTARNKWLRNVSESAESV